MSLQLSTTRPRQLQFCEQGLRRDLRLLEIDEGLLEEIKQNGVVLKGGEGDDAVLCTDDKTYAIKYVETTNTVLLIPRDQDAEEGFACGGSLTPPDAACVRDVGLQTQMQKAARAEDSPPLVATATAAAHLEAVRCPPRLGQLRELLGGCRPYGLEDERAAADGAGAGGCIGGEGSDAMHVDGGGGPVFGFTTEQLLELVQASRAELLCELVSLRAVILGGRWRLVDEGYLGQLLEVVLLSATECGWPLSSIPLNDACGALAEDGYRPELVRHCLEVHGSPADSGGGGGGVARYSLDRSCVCLHFARKLLRQPPGPSADAGPAAAAGGGGSGGGGGAGDGGSRGAWRRSEFLLAWGAAVPEEWRPVDEGLLAGEALEELPEGASEGAEPLLVPFAERDLPLEARARFAALFMRRARWKRSDMEPYLSSLVAGAGGQTVEALLLRHARASQRSPGAPIMFSAR